MGTLHTIDGTDAPTRAGGPHAGVFASDLDLPSWEDFTDARERFFANLAGAPAPDPPRRRRATEGATPAP